MARENHSQDGVDAAFAEIIADLDMPLPEDASEAAGDKGPEIALLMPGVDHDEAMAAVCRLAGISAVCLPSDVGTIVCLKDASQDAAQRAAGAFSSTLRAVPVVLLRRGPSSDPADSDVQAIRWLGGAQQEKLAPGLLLAQAPDVIEALILGALDPATVRGAVDSDSLSRLKATRILGRLLRGDGQGGRG